MAGLDFTPSHTAIQDYAIRTLLEQGLQQEDILVTVRAYNGATKHQFHDLIAPIATIPSEALLLARIQAIRTAYPAISGNDSLDGHISLPKTLNDVEYNKTRTLNEASPSIKTTAAPTAAQPPRKRPVVRRCCPGDNCSWLCHDRSTDGRKNWQSFKPFQDHFIAKHMHTYRNESGAHATCSFCQPPMTFNGDGTQLVQHLWTSHMDPYLSGPTHSTSGSEHSSMDIGCSTPTRHSPSEMDVASTSQL